MSEIAIASVQVQPWEKPFEPQEALKKGTIFSELVKPFFVEEAMAQPSIRPVSDCEAKLLEIQQISFQLIDTQLFLDTHPGEKQALAHRQQLQQQRKQLAEAFARDYYPLTMDCEGREDSRNREPVPWEGGSAHVAL